MVGENIASKLLEINAVQLNPGQPFTWASGWKSPIYCDNRKALSYPMVRNAIKSEICKVIRQFFGGADLLAGVATAGIAWGALAADELKLPYIYVRPTPKQHGLGNQVEGFFEAGKKVVIIEDLVSTGRSSLQVADVLQTQGLIINGMISIFDYGFEVASNAIKSAGINYKSITDYPTLVEVALKSGFISPADENTLLNWRKDPSKWKQDN
ncbi:MAG: orotate phosphoribosyltransferase [Ginsengibacter sp.]